MAILATTVSAASGRELLGSADVYMTFENGIKDDNGNYTIISDGDTPIVEGKFGSGINCKGGINFITVDGFKFGTDSFTFAAWIQCNDQGSDPAIAGTKYWDSGSNIGWVLSARDNDWKYNANTETGSRTDREYLYSKALDDERNVWYHIALVVDRTNEVYNLYINGVPQGEIDFSGNGHTGESYDDEYSGYTFNIGDDGSGIYNANCTFDFDYDEIAVFKRALSAEEITALYEYDPNAVEAADAEDAAEVPVVDVAVTQAEEAPAAPQTGDITAIAAVAVLASLGLAVITKKKK